tara:strand:+ start:510 stop:1052 length:543 start_codon:yes stop_codon:yes gene_type:complete
MKPWNNQIDNRNYLSPIGFKFSITKIPKVDFFSNSASIPGINLGFALQPTYLKDAPVPGDKLTYSDLTLSFFVDENLENYMQVHNWLTGLGYPEDVQQFMDLKRKDPYNDDPDARTPLNEYSDASLFIYNSNYNEVARVDFQDLFPTSLSTIDFNATATDVNYVTAEVTFKYSIYNIVVL